MAENDHLAKLLTATSEPVRLQIIALLCDRKHLNVGEIASQFRLSRPAISHHLKVMKDASILRSEKAGQEIYYWLDSAHIVACLRALADDIEQGHLSVPSE